MNKPIPPAIAEQYTETDFDTLGFHDCRILAIEWDDSAFTSAFRLEYIVQWVEPSDEHERFRFWICPAQLTFANVDDVEIDLKWHGINLECIIDDIEEGEHRMTPNGREQRQWTIRLSTPDGEISLWATGFKLKLLSAPILADIPRLK